MAQYPMFTTLGEIEAVNFEPVFKFLKAEFCSDDLPDFLPQEVYMAFVPLALPSDAAGAADEAEAKFQCWEVQISGGNAATDLTHKHKP
eukprot:8061391-Pyramimonas_sp.AAC.1